MVWMLPPNTTALVQNMDQGVIMVLKAKVKKFYYNKLLKYNMETNYMYLIDNPFTEFMKTYTILDAINDVGKAWEEITPVVIQKCFEKVFNQELFIEKRREEFQVNDEWVGIHFRGFGGDDNDDNDEIEHFNQLNKKNIETITKSLNEVFDNSINRNKSEPEKYHFTTEAIEDDITYDPIFTTDM